MFDTTLISAENNFALWAVLLFAAAFGFWAEKTRWGSRLSAMMVALLVTFILSNLSVIPASAETYDIVWSYLVPIAIPLLLFKADLKRILKEAGPTLIAFFFGGVGTFIGTVIAYNIIPLGEEGWKLAGIFSATYIGGSMNYVAAAEALQMRSGDLLAAGVAADNLVMAAYFMVLFALPSVGFLKKIFNDKEMGVEKNFEQELESGYDKPTLESMAKALAVSFIICAVGFMIADLTGIKGSGILIITAMIVAMATIFPKYTGRIAGADALGTLLMQVFFAAIGASANIMVVLKFGPILFLFAAVILSIHLIIILLAGRLFKLSLPEIIIASNANMGGPTTSAAMAVARKWNALVIPAILCGTLGYAIATFLGVGIGHLLK